MAGHLLSFLFATKLVVHFYKVCRWAFRLVHAEFDTLSKMTTGQLLFAGDYMATSIFNIANEPHANASTTNSSIPPCLAFIIDHILEKTPDRRYVRGHEIPSELRRRAEQVR